MNKKSAIRLGLRIGCAVSALSAAIVQTIAVLWQYDGSANYFQSGASLPTVATVLALLGVALGIVSAILTEKGSLAPTVFAPAPHLNPATLGFAAAMLCMIAGLASGSVPSSSWTALFIACAIVSTFYTVAVDLPSLRKHPSAVTFAGFFAVLACILLNALYYFDFSIEINAPLKIATQVGLLAAMVYFVAELRYLLGTEMPRTFSALAFALVSIGALSSLAVPIAFFTGKLDRMDYLAGALLTLGVMLSAAFRICRLLKAQRKETT